MTTDWATADPTCSRRDYGVDCWWPAPFMYDGKPVCPAHAPVEHFDQVYAIPRPEGYWTKVILDFAIAESKRDD